jgi:hypothetical protein
VEHESILSDALLRQLIAVGQVDILVGLPTLNNATTVADVVRAVQVVFTREFARERTVLVSSDGGSTDGTPDVVHRASFADADRFVGSHSLRTVHRVFAPYHGLPGKRSALRAIFAAADLTQARAVAILDPHGPATTPELVTGLLRPVVGGGVDVLAPRHRRHPRDGLLITQLVRPLVRAVYGAGLDEPLGSELACTGRFASHCLAQDVWDRESIRPGIDLWLRTTALAAGFRVGQVWHPPPPAPSGSGRPTLREAVLQIVLALFECLAAHDEFWIRREGVETLPSWGGEGTPAGEPPAWEPDSLVNMARDDIRELYPVFTTILDRGTLGAIVTAADAPGFGLADETWVRATYEFSAAFHRRVMKIEHLAKAFVPLYLGRAASFMHEAGRETPEQVASRLDELALAFARGKPYLVERWTAE